MVMAEFPPPVLGEPSGGQDAAPGLQIIWTAEDEVRQRAVTHAPGWYQRAMRNLLVAQSANGT
jgi:hypothetical protein